MNKKEEKEFEKELFEFAKKDIVVPEYVDKAIEEGIKKYNNHMF